MYNQIDKKYHPTTTKDQTIQIESVNSTVRDYLGRFHRKTKQVSKSIYMIFRVLYLFFLFRNKKWENIFSYQKIVLPLFQKLFKNN